MGTVIERQSSVAGQDLVRKAAFVSERLVRMSVESPFRAEAEFRIGVGSVPYLADHGFRDMIVVPGSFYIEMALCLERELGAPMARCVKSASFHNPIILSAEDSVDTVIKVEMRHRGGDRFEYAFYEDSASSGSGPHRYAASLQIDRAGDPVDESGAAGFSIETFQAQAQPVSDAARFYQALRRNGNQYGPSFQEISSVWRTGEQSLGRFAAPGTGSHLQKHFLRPSLLDAMSQLLAACVVERGRTFVLRSIESITIADGDFPDSLWGHATLSTPVRDDLIAGNVRLFDDHGQCYLQLSGVVFSFLEDVATITAMPATPTCVIAANFTAEPIEDTLSFWQDYFGQQLRLEFAPYNQIFQQLLDRGSALWRNRDGANVILLRLEEWAAAGARSHLEFDRDKIERSLGGRARCVLPNGLEIAHLNKYETDYLYHEIFTDRCYLKHDVHLRDGATVVDIGANIGMFSLFVLSQCHNPTIYAFEPAPAVYDLLQANGAAYGAQVHTFNLGVSDRPKSATFTFYEKSSVFSGFHPDAADDRHAIEAVVRNMLRRQPMAGEPVEPFVAELTADRLGGQSYLCRLTSVSDIIRENQIDKIDLLKIDAEKSELDIINGIDEQDWPKINQIVMEIHDRSEAAIRQIETLLSDKGFSCAVEQERLLEEGGLFNLFATRSHGNEVVQIAADGPAKRLTRNLEDFCAGVRGVSSQSGGSLVVLLCPPTPGLDAEMTTALNAAETALLAELETLPNVFAVTSAAVLKPYPLHDYHDPHSHATAHVPYTPAGYAAMGSALARTLFSIARQPFKVIVLDCDNTLWKGVCGEDGCQGIEISEPYRLLQQFMVEQSQAGMLLCLCSKNNEKDVLEVFDGRPDMVLKRDHLVAWRINWNRKSDNLQALAQELNLGLDSFIFIDDNPVECAEMRIACPSVVTLQLPQESGAIPAFLRHLWAFDRSGRLTEEDRSRTKMYQENAQRQQYFSGALSLKDFIKGLQLRVEIAPMTDDHLGRVSQQTLRTNQFNFTTMRRSEGEIKAFLAKPQAHCQVVRVVDRFGDYGLVGVLMYEELADRLKVDTFLLSCRVLGRGVEHFIVAWLGRRALEHAKAAVEFVYLPTAKNAPAGEFIGSIGAHYRNGAGPSWMLPASYLAALEYAPDDNAPIRGDEASGESADLQVSPAAAAIAGRSERLQRIADELNDIEKLTRAIDNFRMKPAGVAVEDDATQANQTEAALRHIWKKVLGRPHIGLKENFFEVGGSSLRAVQVIAEIKKELKRTLSIVNLFEAPTIALLAAKLHGPEREAAGEPAVNEAARRGQQRRALPSRPRAT